MSRQTPRILSALALLGAALALTACAGPGHRAFFEQLTVAGSAQPVLSMQGYVISSAQEEQQQSLVAAGVCLQARRWKLPTAREMNKLSSKGAHGINSG